VIGRPVQAGAENRVAEMFSKSPVFNSAIRNSGDQNLLEGLELL
jgi:hypothetical protein